MIFSFINTRVISVSFRFCEDLMFLLMVVDVEGGGGGW